MSVMKLMSFIMCIGNLYAFSKGFIKSKGFSSVPRSLISNNLSQRYGSYKCGSKLYSGIDESGPDDVGEVNKSTTDMSTKDIIETKTSEIPSTDTNNSPSSTPKSFIQTFLDQVSNVKKQKLFTKENLAKLGLNVLLSYGFVSNVSSITCLIISWIIYGKTAKVSPLAPGKWKGLLAVYAGIWAANNLLRPIRVSIAILLAPAFENFVTEVQNRTGLKRSLATGIVVFLVNIIGSFTYLFSGLFIATSICRVPLFPTS